MCKRNAPCGTAVALQQGIFHAADIGNLENTVGRLVEGLRRYQRNTAGTQSRDVLVQRFEPAVDGGCGGPGDGERVIPGNYPVA